MKDRGCLRIAGLVLSLPVLLFVLLFMPFVVELILYTALGWGFFLARVVPLAKVDRAGLATGIVCLVLFAVGSHAFARRFYESPGTDRAPDGRRWKSRWTAIGV